MAKLSISHGCLRDILDTSTVRLSSVGGSKGGCGEIVKSCGTPTKGHVMCWNRSGLYSLILLYRYQCLFTVKQLTWTRERIVCLFSLCERSNTLIGPQMDSLNWN